MHRLVAGILAIVLGAILARADGINIPAPSWTYSITSLGTGVATALGINVGSAGAPVVNGGALGTPSSGTATNLSGTAASLTAGNVTTNANLTGPITSTGNATAIASQTGTGTKFVVDTSPTLVTPVLGAATATTINGAAIDNSAWTTYTPTLACQVGTITTATPAGAYKVIGKSTFISVKIVITTLGTCSGFFTMTLPNTPNRDGVLNGTENQSTGVSLKVALNSGSTTTGSISNYLNVATPATGTFLLSGVYENQ